MKDKALKVIEKHYSLSGITSQSIFMQHVKEQCIVNDIQLYKINKYQNI